MSNREIDLQGTPGRCTACSLHLGEVDARGGPAPVPSRLQGFSAPLSGPTTQVLLLPGRSLTHRVTIVLWSDYLQAGTTIWSRSGGRLSSLIVSTPTLTLHLYPAPAPRVQLRVTDREPEALIHPSAGVHGPYLYQASVLCRTENGTSVAAEQPALGEVDDLWAAGSGPTLTPLPCPTAYGPTSLSRWHAVLGWLNHAVGTVSYVKH